VSREIKPVIAMMAGAIDTMTGAEKLILSTTPAIEIIEMTKAKICPLPLYFIEAFINLLLFSLR
jgi:hypothetical protein